MRAKHTGWERYMANPQVAADWHLENGGTDLEAAWILRDGRLPPESILESISAVGIVSG